MAEETFGMYLKSSLLGARTLLGGGHRYEEQGRY